MNVRIRDIATVRTGLNRSGRGSGARPGPDSVKLVSGVDIQGDRVVRSTLESVPIEANDLTLPHILRKGDVLVTGKSTSVKAALFPPEVGYAVANSTLLVVRPVDPVLGPIVWWYLTSRKGRRDAESRMVAGAALSSLLPSALAEIEVPFPPRAELSRLAELIEASERAYWSAREAADIRREALRERIVAELTARAADEEGVHATN